VCYWQERGHIVQQPRSNPAAVDVVKKQDLGKVGSVGNVVRQVQSAATLNGHGRSQPRPSRLELDDNDGGQNGTLAAASSSAAATAPTSNDSASQLPSSAATAGNETQPAKIAAAVVNSAAAEINGNSQSSSSSDAVVISGVPLPSPPVTPPTAVVKSVQSVGGQIVLPSPARSYRSPRQDARKNSTPDSIELPPPPSPPLQFCHSSSLDSPGGVLPPPPLDDSLYTIPPRVSPPPPMSPVSSAAVANLMTSNATPSKSVASSGELSTFVVDQATSLVDGLSALSDRMSGFEGDAQDCSESVSGDQPLVRDTRSDLLAAIREGTYVCWLAFFLHS